MPRKNFYLFAAELGPEAATDAVIGRNPDRDLSKPVVKVSYISGELPSRRFDGNDFSSMRNPLKRHAKRLLPLLGGANPYAEGHNRRAGIRAAKQRIVEELRSKGYTVYDPEPSANRRLYVLELDPAILKARQPNSTYTKALDHGESGLPPIYVGETGKSREQRLADHKQEKNTSVGGYVLTLRMDLVEPTEPLRPLQALRAERKLARSLGQAGYPVYGGH